ncbi:hypothetical protein [Streptomyces californicus]|uniref:hypothetical protein n=1 Tax=Streptomyces californicus TaxID=67351 RepID=UPI0037BB3F30
MILQFATAYALEQAGLSEEELAAARSLSGQDLLDYLKDNGAEILVELFAEDIMECVDDPDIGICVWAIVQNAGPVELVKIGSKLPRIGKVIWGIKEFLEKVDKARKKVDTFTDKLDGAKEKLERLKATCDRGSGGGTFGASKASTVQRPSARADDGPKSDTGCVFPIFRTPKTVDVAYEKLHGPNPASRVEGGNDLIYFGEQSVAAEYWGRGTFAAGMYRYDMDMQFLVQFAKAAKRYDWKGPNGTPGIEWEIPYSRPAEFNRLTVDRTWIPKPRGDRPTCRRRSTTNTTCASSRCAPGAWTWCSPTAPRGRSSTPRTRTGRTVTRSRWSAPSSGPWSWTTSATPSG